MGMEGTEWGWEGGGVGVCNHRVLLASGGERQGQGSKRSTKTNPGWSKYITPSPPTPPAPAPVPAPVGRGATHSRLPRGAPSTLTHTHLPLVASYSLTSLLYSL